MAFAARARAAGAWDVWAFATGAVRDAVDGADFAATVGVEAGVQVEVIDGTREARLAYAAVAVLAHCGPLLAVDVGGRTTELSLGNGAEAPATVSLPLGALALTEAHMRRDPPAPVELAAVAAAVAALLATTDLPARARAARAVVVASGGTATALAALDLGLATYAPRRVHGHVLSRPVLRQHRERLAAMPLAARAALPALDAGRAAILPAGALVLEHVAAAAGASGIQVSDHGVRHAYLAERLAGFGVVPDLRGLWG
jgi:exopolyphosphatase/guanosine-5'-triphosphate,3'-diphosphate pyrophosphatase